MSSKLHGCATTTHAIRRAIQESKESINTLAKRYNINPSTVIKWKRRGTVEDRRPGPESRSKSLTREEEAFVIAFRKYSLLSLNDCLYVLKEVIPHLSRSCLYRCFQRSGTTKLPELIKKKEKRKKFKEYRPGYVHMDITTIRTEEGRRYLFVAIDRTTKFCCVGFYEHQTKENAIDFLQKVVTKFPNKIQKILTDNGTQFTHHSPKAKENHDFTLACKELGIEHRLTAPFSPWTNGQVERMNRTIKEATVKKYYYKDFETLDRHLQSFLDVYTTIRKN